MGTSSPNGGSSGSNPLVPSWLSDPILGDQGSTEAGDDEQNPPQESNTGTQPPTPTHANPQRYSVARSNFTRFVKSRGADRESLRRSVSSYVRQSSGGAKNAMAKMGSSRKSASKLLGFLQEAASNGIESALKSLNLQTLVGKSVSEIFIELSDFICPEGGSVDAGIAREAFIETIADITEQQIISDEGNLNTVQMQTIFEIYIAHTIEDKLLNEIGTNMFFQTQTPEDAELIQDQLYDFIKNSVSDALAGIDGSVENLSQNEVSGFVDGIYEQTFILLSALYEKGNS